MEPEVVATVVGGDSVESHTDPEDVATESTSPSANTQNRVTVIACPLFYRLLHSPAQRLPRSALPADLSR